jgi:cytoskeletal protein CcmA (bactofilin family)
MFSKKKKPVSAKIDTLIGQGTEITGDLVFSGGLHVDGRVIGNVKSDKDKDSLLILSEFGYIEGDISVPNMVLNGNIVGDVFGSKRVELASKARVNGSVYYNLIEMAIGAEVNGGLVHESPENLEPRQLEDKSKPAEDAPELATENT